MKTKTFFTVIAVVITALTMTSCDKSDDLLQTETTPLTLLSVGSDGATSITKSSVVPLLQVTSELTADEIELLYAIREDDKLAHDVYTTFSAKYPNVSQFSKFATAKKSHIACTETILSYYEIEFPALTEVGVFSDTARQASFDALVQKCETVVEAFTTMASIEEQTIASYKKIQPSISNVNISFMIGNMIKASSNHLRAAVRQIEVSGGSYTPVFLSQSEFEGIVKNGFQQGSSQNQHKGHGGNTNSQKGGNGKGCKGSVNNTGHCTGASNGSGSGSGAGKGYRGGRFNS